MDVFEKLSEMNIKTYEIGECDKPNVLFKLSDDFFRFLNHVNTDYVFVIKNYSTLEETIISENIISELDKDVIAELSEHIIKYNSLCKEVNYDIPISVEIYYFAGDIKYCYIEKTNAFYDEHNLGDPFKKLEEIVVSNEELLREMNDKLQAKYDYEKNLLKEALMAEKEFLYCTNKASRFIFLQNFLNGEISNKCPNVAKQFSERYGRGKTEAQAFVDMTFHELRMRNLK